MSFSTFGLPKRRLCLAAAALAVLWSQGCSKKSEPEASTTKKEAARPRVSGDGIGSDERHEARSNDDPGPRARPEETASKVGGANTVKAARSVAKGKRRDRKAVYSLYMQGSKVGTMTAEEKYKGNEVTSRVDARLTLRRAGVTVKLRTLETFTEKLDGTPVSFRVLMDQHVSKMEARGVYKDGKMIVKDKTGKRTISYDEEWLFPWSAAQLAKSKGFKPGTTYTYMKFEPQLGMKGISLTHQVLGDAKVNVMGQAKKCHRIKVTSSELPAQTACVDDELVAYTMDFNVGPFVMKMKLEKRVP
jgi:hypothetical protein